MSVHDLSMGEGVVEQVTRTAEAVLAQYGIPLESNLSLLEISENATFVVEASGSKMALRVHRLGYHSLQEIRSEVTWSETLRIGGFVRTPAVIPAIDGELVTVATVDGIERCCVLFDYVDGYQLTSEPTLEQFEVIGATAAKMHCQSRLWSPPADFDRFSWDIDACFGAAARWGNYRAGSGLTPSEILVLERAERTIRRRLGAYGTSAEVFGLIHADMRATNMIWDDHGQMTLIDFDDCGYSWFMYDLACALSFMEHSENRMRLVDAWLAGYRSVAPVSAEDTAELETLILLRRMILVAWIGSHPAAPSAMAQNQIYCHTTVELADIYLSGHS